MHELDLQALLRDNPELLEPLGVDLKFLPVGWETSLGSGAVDLVFLDSEGYITLVETKLRANDEIRRKVVGQLLEYAAYAAEWDVPDVQQLAESFLQSAFAPTDLRDVGDLAGAMVRRFGWSEEDPAEAQRKVDTVLSKLDASLSAGRMRVICGVDESVETLDRIVAYLSAHSDLKVVLLQVNRFTIDEEEVLVPTFIGAVDAGSPRREVPRTGRLTRDSLLGGFEDDAQRDAAKSLLDIAAKLGATFEFGPSGVSVRARTPAHRQPVTVAWIYAPGKEGWMRTKAVTLGHGLDSGTTDAHLRRTLDEYYERLAALPGSDDASGKGVRARWWSYEASVARAGDLGLELERIITALAGTQPDVSV